MRGESLMPTTPRKARVLLKKGRAKVVQRTPFIIQLLYATGEAKQKVVLGVDSGYIHIGLSAVSEKEELYSSEVELRSDIVKLNAERRMYRRSRRNRKTRYRQPRFLNRKKPEGWLAPSLQHKLDSHVKIIQKVCDLLPIAKIIVEVAAFDIQKIKHPEIQGKEYQQGEQKDFWNVREYVLYRDHYTCQHCKGMSKDPILNVHHIESRQIGGDRPGNLITLCEDCHDKHHRGEIQLKVKKTNGFRAETFMTTIRWKLVNQLRELGYCVKHTYGYKTKARRIALKLKKSHRNDAFVIAHGSHQIRSMVWYVQKQVRKCNRKLFKGIGSHIKNTAARMIHGFQRYDKVLWNEIECFVFGRRSSGYFDLRLLDGTRVHASASWKQLCLLENARTVLTEVCDSSR